MPNPPKQHDDGPAADAKSLGFEESLAQLEEIVERIEAGEIGLEESLKQYERGMHLIKRCREILKTAEQRVEELERQGKAGQD